MKHSPTTGVLYRSSISIYELQRIILARGNRRLDFHSCTMQGKQIPVLSAVCELASTFMQASGSPFVSFFQSLPRYGFNIRQRMLSDVYIDSLIISTSPFLALLLVCFFHTLTGGRRNPPAKLNTSSKTYGSVSASEKTSEEDEQENDVGSPMSALRASFLFIITTSALALALAANWHLWSGTATTLSVARSSATQLTTDAHGVLAVAERFLVRLNRQLSKHPLLQKALSASISFDSASQLRSVRSAQTQFDTTADTVLNITNSSQRVSNFVYLLVFCCVVMLGIALASLFLRQRTGLRMLSFTAGFSWFCVALATLAALISSDTCTNLSEFHQILLMQADHIPNDAKLTKATATNLFTTSGVQCPSKFVKSTIPLQQMARNFKLLFDNKITSLLLRYVYPKSSSSQRKQLRHWLVLHIEDAVSCEMMITHVGKISSAFCARKGPMLALFAVWIALIVIAVALTISAFTAHHTDSVTWYRFIPQIPHCDTDKSNNVKQN